MKWYLNRLKTMSLAEIVFRFRQQIQKYYEKQWKTNWFPNIQPVSIGNTIFDCSDIQFPEYGTQINIFGISFDYAGEIDWHLDISSGKKFPETFSKNINIRNSRYGSAKFVWEINRLQFLPWICMNYKRTGKKDDLNLFMYILTSWMRQNPYLKGVNWYSNIEVNIRLINWFFCWNILDVNALIKNHSDFASFVKNKWLPLIYLHCYYSYKNPSKYSSANNHLISEYAGLFIASSLWKFKSSGKWLEKSRKGLEKEIIRQHSENGINKEEAAEYIQFITDFFLLSYMVDKKTQNLFSESYKARLQKIIEYIYNFTDMFGNYPNYGDDDDGRVIIFENDAESYNNFKSIITSGVLLFGDNTYLAKSYLTSDVKNMVLFGQKQYDKLSNKSIPPPEVHSAFYPQEGHFISKFSNKKFEEIYIHFDAASLGYLSIAAHGHADALSFLLKVDGQEVFTDPGTYTYHTEEAWRQYFISTLAHNTLVVNNQNQAINGGPTLWIKHYRTTVHHAEIIADRDIIEASHNGYEDIGVAHLRKMNIDKQNAIVTIEDIIQLKEEGKKHHITMPFHLHPSITNIDIGKYNIIILNFQKGAVHIKPDSVFDSNIEIVRGNISPMAGWYSPSFYKKEKSNTVLLNCDINKSMTLKTSISLQNNSLNK
jgi:hypothetical protein